MVHRVIVKVFPSVDLTNLKWENNFYSWMHFPLLAPIFLNRVTGEGSMSLWASQGRWGQRWSGPCRWSAGDHSPQSLHVPLGICPCVWDERTGPGAILVLSDLIPWILTHTHRTVYIEAYTLPKPSPLLSERSWKTTKKEYLELDVNHNFSVSYLIWYKEIILLSGKQFLSYYNIMIENYLCNLISRGF